jgi:tRNA(fMet)-specific endonuclease VapC
VLGELFYGASKSTNVKDNIERIKNFADYTSILSCDSETAMFYGIIKNQLKLIGKPIPENDIWIASIAKQHKLTLITRDDHFKFVEEISTEMW